MRYKLVLNRDIEEFVRLVQRNIDEGWKPLGGPVYAITSDGGEILQALTMQEKDREIEPASYPTVSGLSHNCLEGWEGVAR